jgi:hypothetical protein
LNNNNQIINNLILYYKYLEIFFECMNTQNKNNILKK